MSLRYPLENLGSIWYHSEHSDVPYSLNQFLGWDIFAVSYSKTALNYILINDNDKKAKTNSHSFFSVFHLLDSARMKC